VRQILRELNLSDDLLEEAIQKLEEGRIVAKKKQKLLSTVVVVGIVLAVLGLTTFFMTSSYTDQLAKVTGAGTRITSQVESSADLSVVSAGSGTIFARITLHDVPQGTRLPMEAKWIAPDGSVFHENKWQTKPVDRQTWETHAKCDIPTSAPKGNWLVKFSIAGRELATQKFVVN
ncbi:MAG: hypothetical protein K2X81_15405, partial [Candidatus Obscuribacterales bacterium]|nr:hypothetical protein [Candidatus Obscuribacterales bacterium]